MDSRTFHSSDSKGAASTGDGPAMLLSFWAWAAVVVIGMFALQSYESIPGRVATAAAQWPEEVSITSNPSGPTLVMFLHPKCPCSRASVHELNTLLAHCKERVQAIVVFVLPPGAGEDWLDSSICQSVSTIDGIQAQIDRGGGLARRFGAMTSGHVMLYGSDGRRTFSGGITRTRGHVGDNAGRTAIRKWLESSDRAVEAESSSRSLAASTPVYGCPLFEGSQELCKDQGQCCRN